VAVANFPAIARIRELEAETERLRQALAEAQQQKRNADDAEVLSLTLAKPGEGITPRKERILVVEDHPFDRKVTQLMLTSLGYSSDHVATGQEALAALARKRYDIVLMDVQMQKLDGIETTRCIRQRWPGPKGPRVIALTSRSMKGDREVCLAAGMDDYMSKPVPLQVLDAKLRSEMQPLVDARQLERCAELMGKPALGRMIDSFLADLRVLVGDLYEALIGQHAERLVEAADTLRVNCEILGVRRLPPLAGVLQRFALAGDLVKAAPVLSAIESLQTPLERELQDLRKRYA
jgi:CheY-like chemotaxis protein